MHPTSLGFKVICEDWQPAYYLSDETEAKSVCDEYNESNLCNYEHYVVEIFECHCGRPTIYHLLGDEKPFTRDLCEVCDPVRCDAFPGACND